MNSPDGTQIKDHKRGRPSKKEELDIERELRSCFSDGRSVWSASEKTGHSVNTVRKYYKRFHAWIKESESPEFVEACKDRVVLTRIALGRQLLKMERMQDDLEKTSPQNAIQYIQVNKLKVGVMQAITDLHLKILNIANAPTVDEFLAALREAGDPA